MISFEEAYEKVLNEKIQLAVEECSLENSFQRVLAEDLHAPIPHPYLDVSAVDGYALKLDPNHSSYAVVDEIPAGKRLEHKIAKGECARIFTGAPLPEGTDTVVMQEHVSIEGEAIRLLQKTQKHANVRFRAEQIQANDCLLRTGHQINSASMALMKSLDIKGFKVYRKLRMKVLVTGNEFAESRFDLEGGKIFESNGLSIMHSIAPELCEVSYEVCGDDLEALSARIAEAEQTSDVLILTGGVSVGDYDFSRAALENNDFKVLFHKVRQKPGKPLLFARKGGVIAFGLPGNPRAVHVALEVFIKDWMRVCLGAQPRKRLYLPLAHYYLRKGDRAEFMSAVYSPQGLVLNDKQASHMLLSFAKADFLVYFPAEKTHFSSADVLECIDLRNGN